ncbi:TonB-dependent receptor domain-containing protein [Brevundimonas sp. R86498]|uniref:TonB-dependent receptor domain-containing protein n=1 Tax=Brevundimonas sp. R86498 TaxID=3093845 RepID=UPI0037CC54E3
MTTQRSRLLGTTLLTTLALTLMAAPTVTMAQDADQASDVDEIVVTGSRIRRSPTNSPTPLIQIGQEEVLQSGEVNVVDFLADIPALSGSTVPEDTTGSNLNDGGLSLLSLRNLGAGRTLTLVDGRRHVGSQPGTLAVDVDTIPRLLIESTEVITGGAAAVYGADAVSGVVNFIMRKDFDGLEIDGSIAEVNQDHQLSERLSILWGKNLLDDRLNVYVSGEYQGSEEVLDSDVDWRRESWGFLTMDADPASAPADGVTDLVLVRDIRTYIRGTNYGGVTILATGVQPSPASDPDVTFATCPTTSFSANCFSLAPNNNPDNAYLYDGSGASQPVVFGPIRSEVGYTRPSSNGGLGQVQNTEQGQASRLPESTNYRFQTGLNFAVTEDIELFAEAKYVEEETYDAGQRVFHDFNIRAFAPGTVGAITGNSAFEIGLDNAYMPADVRTAILNNTRQVYNSAGVQTGTVADPRAQHKLYGPARNQLNNRDLQRYVIGLRGDAGDIGFVRNVNWEMGYTYGEMNNSNRELGVDNVRYQAAVDAVVDTAGIVNGKAGEVVCRVQLLSAQGIAVPDAVVGGTTYSRQGDVISECVPVRVFGEGGFSQDALDYIQASVTVTDQNKQHDFLTYASGELWDFWGAGPIGASIGYEYRKEITSGTGRDKDTAGRYLFLNAGPDFEEASYDTNDIFAELSLPLLRDSWLGRSAEISGAYRYSDYSNVGEQETYSVMFQYRPVDQLMLRATTATAIRVPNLGETNDPLGQTFANGFSDPCSATVLNNLADQSIRANRITNCATLAQQSGLSFTFDTPNAANSYLPNYGSGSVSGLSGGNPFLQPETSESFTYGFVWTPDYLLPNLSIVMDYYDIEIQDAIASVSAQNAANQCVSGDNLNVGACATQTRDATTFQVTSFIQGSLNYAALTAKGVDFNTRWGGDIFRFGGRDWGTFSHSIRGTWLIEQHDFVNIVDPTNSTDDEDTVGMPRVRFLSTLSWSPIQDLAFVWDWDWQASQEREDIDNIISNWDRYDNLKYLETGDYSQHDFSVRWQAREDLIVRAGVVNAFDADPAPWLGNTTEDNFDLFGRRFYVSFNFKAF